MVKRRRQFSIFAAALFLLAAAVRSDATAGWLFYALSGMAILCLFAALFTREPVPGRALTTPNAAPVKPEGGASFEDVAANEEALSSLRELRDFLRHPETYAKLGARIPHGVLLYGPPGTGKTLLARALAGEAGVPFLAMNGSDFVEMYVGVGASRVRDTFKKARKLGRCVIFIDEIDSLGRSRGANSSDERDQTLNALLGEMSGFRPAEGVIVIGATNRAEMLDPALLRPGRFDRRIEVAMPDRDAREKILRLHARGKPMDADVDLSDLAARTVLFRARRLKIF